MLSHEQMKIAERHGRNMPSVYVYEAPVRIWHWITVLAMTTLMATGYFIGAPFLQLPGEDPGMYLMGYVRFAHFAAGYVFAIAFAGRIYWAFAGNEHARQIFCPPLLSGAWWSEVMFEARWYFFLEDKPKKYVGHNPLAATMMFFMFVLGSAFMIASGFALYSEGAGAGHWSDAVFGWVLPFIGDSQLVHTLHRLGMWVLITFVIVHVYAAVREDIMSRQSIVSTMISGWRSFRD
ncbi:MAG: Ni/Fe-hydrogenase, b-type cytochrome subunit [Gammaproteobacteria bacterium]|jgi:Ni/Fe-hydrogenase 1 B-type cytochrome subunit|nr:Ni/Fe-hydrogenase, b-type cytochrome subunit [Gammaproteobacteria bacterium]MBU0772481.1 Ni/Fe-hydrogenase, b-type cytochrome subunit [Gammaproteobacteria bacterium]MBU0855026.1 Ni/Fe-hydrogenase, b-type cytochrome subunit [Gammaproteobacteria bacterium]MBU1847215.1 Ni/Fe-hydrogenase, b-type cytochrome subunit [Gammaproteobacteria bacterium]